MRRFTPQQRQLIASMLEEEHRNCVFNVLHFLSDQIVGGLRLNFHGVELPMEPYGENLYMDWAWRLSGQPWPAQGQDWQDTVNSSEEE